jgi:hypothetical protein
MTLSSCRIASMIPCMRSPTTERTEDRDLAQMERWTAWVIRLTSHAASQATLPSARERIEGATEDAESLRRALEAAASGWLDAGQVAIVHSVYDLWDANHDRTERLCAVVDPAWHRRWRMRSAGRRPERLNATSERPLSEVAV